MRFLICASESVLFAGDSLKEGDNGVRFILSCCVIAFEIWTITVNETEANHESASIYRAVVSLLLKCLREESCLEYFFSSDNGYIDY